MFHGGKVSRIACMFVFRRKTFAVLHLQLEYKRLEYFHFIVTSANTMDAEHVVESCVSGYHYYQNIWNPIIDEAFTCVGEDGNPHDRCAVAVSKDARVVGHVARKISTVCYLFLQIWISFSLKFNCITN